MAYSCALSDGEKAEVARLLKLAHGAAEVGLVETANWAFDQAFEIQQAKIEENARHLAELGDGGIFLGLAACMRKLHDRTRAR